jgi:RNA recognition motif-containing protein
MSKKLYVGNIEWVVKEPDLEALFGEHGELEEVIIIKDKMSGRSKGFGFVTFANDADADAAMAALDGYELNGRKLTVNEARPRQE